MDYHIYLGHTFQTLPATANAKATGILKCGGRSAMRCYAMLCNAAATIAAEAAAASEHLGAKPIGTIIYLGIERQSIILSESFGADAIGNIIIFENLGAKTIGSTIIV